MADYLIDTRFRDARNLIATCIGLAFGMGLMAHAMPLSAPSTDGVRVLSGGDGAEAVATLRAAAANYSLQVEFVAPAAAVSQATSAMPVTIRDARGRTVVDAVARGPLLLAALPPGVYTVEARDGERSASEVVNIHWWQHQRLMFVL